jgi:NADP-dependent 3-hydroxy acid dehydrogenase YdfG
MKPNAFHDQVVIITGASAGIGRSLALLLAGQCAKVVIAARRAEHLEKIAEQCHAFCGEVMVIPTDVSDEMQCKALIDKTIAAYSSPI